MSDELKPLSVTIKQACAITGLGTTSIYDLIGRGVLSTKKSGRRTLVRYPSLEAYINDDQPAAA